MALPKMIEVEVYGGSGGPENNGVPVRPGRYEMNFGYVLNGEHLLMCEDTGNTAWHRSTWSRVLFPDGTLPFVSPNGENWMERQGHLRVVEPAPVPVPPPPAETGVTPAQAGEALGTLVAFVRQVWG